MKDRCVWIYGLIIILTHTSLRVPMAHGDTFDCLIKPYMVVNISSAVQGVLEAVTVDRGDLVKQGQVLVRLESSVEQATVARFRARAGMEAPIQINEARLELSKRQYTRNAGLYAKALIAADEMDQVKTTTRLAELDLREAVETHQLAELDLQRAIAELTRRTVRSPINGVVVDRLRHPGEFADENPILTLAQLHPLRVDVFVPVTWFGQIEVGMLADVMPELPVGGVHEARVSTVDRVIDAASGMFGVRLELPNRNYRLPGGLKCQVRFHPRHATASEALTAQSESPLPPPATVVVPTPITPTQVALSSPWSTSASMPPDLDTDFHNARSDQVHLTPSEDQQMPASKSLSSAQSHVTASVPESPATPALSPPAAPTSPAPVVGKIKPGETASGIFLRAGIGTAQAMTLRQAVRAVYDIWRLHIGHAYRLELGTEGNLQRFTYEIDRKRQLTVERQQGTFVGHIEAISREKHEPPASGQTVRAGVRHAGQSG